MSNQKGFWSYVHADDDADGGRICQLAMDIKNQYEMISGEELEIFVDKNDIEWGKAWRDVINSSLASVAFFIPIITPRFFASPACRNELQTFARRAEKMGIRDLVLPIIYVEIPGFLMDKNDDELIELIKSLQWKKWSSIRFKDVKSEEYRAGVFKIAEELYEINRISKQGIPEENLPPEKIKNDEKEGEDNTTPGLIDKLANTEDQLQKIPGTLEFMRKDIELIGDKFEIATTRTTQADENKKGFAVRLEIIRELARQLQEPIERIFSQSNTYASQLHEINEGIQILIKRAPIEISEDPNARKQYCDLFKNIRGFSNASEGMVEGTSKMVNASETLGSLSRDLRPLMARLKQGLTMLIESTEVIKEWERLIDDTEISCDDLKTD